MIQVMECRLLGVKPFIEGLLIIEKGTPRNPVKYESKHKHNFLPENAFQNVVCKMSAIFLGLNISIPNKAYTTHINLHRSPFVFLIIFMKYNHNAQTENRRNVRDSPSLALQTC